ncbi:MAG: hypothetical protein LBQ40_02345 [Clostridiales bacterium]|nr:hypothetical protein [Clostridiales bacterium]
MFAETAAFREYSVGVRIRGASRVPPQCRDIPPPPSGFCGIKMQNDF